MQILDRTRSLMLLAELPIIRLAGYDAERNACYAVPLAFALDGADLLIAVRDGGRLARLLNSQPDGLCVEADDVRPDLSFRSVVGTVRALPLDDANIALVPLAARYAAEWGRWRPCGTVRAYRLRLNTLQGRET